MNSNNFSLQSMFYGFFCQKPGIMLIWIIELINMHMYHFIHTLCCFKKNIQMFCFMSFVTFRKPTDDINKLRANVKPLTSTWCENPIMHLVHVFNFNIFFIVVTKFLCGFDG